MTKADELRLQELAKRLLATPHKQREESHFGKPRVKRRASPKKKAAPKRG